MERVVRDALVDALEGAAEKSVRDWLAESLGYGEKGVQDEGIFKRKRGRPRKDADANGLGDLPKDSLARAALLKEKKAKARLQDRLNPGSTAEEKRRVTLNADLREIGWDLEESPGRADDFKEMEAELAVLRKESGIKGNGDGFAPWEKFYGDAKAFKELKDEAYTYYNKAKEFLEKGDFRRVEEFTAFLKPKAEEIAKAFEGLQESFDSLCEAYCDMADKERMRNVAEDPAAMESERQGMGMMDGEDFAMYARRMRSLGMGREIPKSAKSIDGTVEATERKWRSVAGLSQDEFSKVKSNWAKTVRPLLHKGMISSRMKVDGLNRLLQYGLDFGDNDIAYGVLQPSVYSDRSRCCGAQYGGIAVRWKPYCVVAAMSFEDCIRMGRGGHDYVCPSFVTNPSPCSFEPECGVLISRLKKGPVDTMLADLCRTVGADYCEIQFHGDGERYGAESVAEIHFSSEYEVCNLTVEALAAIAANGIPLFVNGERIELDGGKIVKTADEGDSDSEDGDAEASGESMQEGDA